MRRHELLAAGHARLVDCHAEPFGSPGLQWAVYDLAPAPAGGKNAIQRAVTVLAFRGTTDLQGGSVAAEVKTVVDGRALPICCC